MGEGRVFRKSSAGGDGGAIPQTEPMATILECSLRSIILTLFVCEC